MMMRSMPRHQMHHGCIRSGRTVKYQVTGTVRRPWHAEGAAGPHAAPQAARVHANCRMLHLMQLRALAASSPRNAANCGCSGGQAARGRSPSACSSKSAGHSSPSVPTTRTGCGRRRQTHRRPHLLAPTAGRPARSRLVRTLPPRPRRRYAQAAGDPPQTRQREASTDSRKGPGFRGAQDHLICALTLCPARKTKTYGRISRAGTILSVMTRDRDGRSPGSP